MSEIDRINQEFSVFASQHGIGAAAVQKVCIALDDLLNNIISYGFNDGEDHIIQITLDYAEGRLEITIKDDGVPFNPFDQAQPDTALTVEERKIGELGVLLVKELMSDVSYQRQQGSNVVTLILNTVP